MKGRKEETPQAVEPDEEEDVFEEDEDVFDEETGPLAHAGRRAGTFLAGMALGALVGAGLALLFAPQSGEDTRYQVSRRARRFARDARDRYDDLRDKVHRARRLRREEADEDEEDEEQEG
jgi:hypothetical protein